jgi:hypothetical protein
MKKQWIALLATLIIISACVFVPSKKEPPGDVEPDVSSTSQALTSIPQTTVLPTDAPMRGIPVTFNNVTFNIPLELRSSANPSTSTDVEFPYINPSGGLMAEHLAFQIAGYPVPRDARILVFKTSDYAAYGPVSQNGVTSLLDNQDAYQPLPETLAKGFYAQAKTVAFKNGHGVRYLSQIMTGYAPVSNTDLFYYYQGITNDGAFFVSAVLPVKTAFLPEDGAIDSPLTADGVAFPADPAAPGEFSKYLDQITQKLNGTALEVFTPSLSSLDSLIGSINVANP